MYKCTSQNRFFVFNKLWRTVSMNSEIATNLVAPLIALVAILQIVTLVLIVRRAPKKDGQIKAPFPPQRNDRPNNRPENRPDNRSGNRPNNRPDNRNARPSGPQDNRQRNQPQSQAPVTSVDKSLRDINLRLKNAEKDQENVRRNFNDRPPMREGQPSQQRRPDRQERFERQDRSLDRSTMRPRQQGQQPLLRTAAPVVQPRPERIAEAAPVAVLAEPVSIPEPIVPIIAPVVEQNVAEVSAPVIANELEHGRKVSVKRRVLKVGEEGEDVAASNDTQETSAPVSAEQPVENQPKSSDIMDSVVVKPAAEVSFGRRRR
jgi:hypothetical protein